MKNERKLKNSGSSYFLHRTSYFGFPIFAS